MAKGSFTFYIDELDVEDFNKIMNQWETLDERKEIEDVLKESGQDMVHLGKQRLPMHNFKWSKGSPGVKSGHLINSLGYRYSRNLQGPQVKAGFKRGIGGGNHSHLIDRGTAKRGYYKNGKWHNTGSVSAGLPNTGSKFWTSVVHTVGAHGMNELMEVVYRALDKISTR